MHLQSFDFYLHTTIFCALAYLLGSIPSAVWVGKKYYGLDVREHGSGNAGATNVFRVLGKKAGIIVLTLDVLKGYLATALIWVFKSEYSNFDWSSFHIVNIQLVLGMFAVLGHLLPIFAGFRGGKGIATLAGMIIALNAFVALIAISLFLIILFTTRFVSVGSMVGGISIPVLFVSVFGENQPEYRQPSVIIFTMAIAVLVVVTHRKNINRLIHGNENKAKLLPKHRRINS